LKIFFLENSQRKKIQDHSREKKSRIIPGKKNPGSFQGKKIQDLSREKKSRIIPGKKNPGSFQEKKIQEEFQIQALGFPCLCSFKSEIFSKSVSIEISYVKNLYFKNQNSSLLFIVEIIHSYHASFLILADTYNLYKKRSEKGIG
jgi:hypothetical protein